MQGAIKIHRKKTAEVLCPGGSLESALAGLEAGADGVYLGLKAFSARKGAQNFSWEDLDLVRAYGTSKGKNIYVALNTLVSDQELDDFLETAAALAERRVQGIILQDPALAWFLHREMPSLVLHGSTQMGVHNSWGLEEAARLGLKRVVLSRELTFEEIKTLREEFPEMELEVFVQGALCYGFSGLCLASGTLLGRSANRGECAQVCRTWFETPQGQAFAFSTGDLTLGPLVRDLSDAGIDSLKIEGRMKGPQYTALAAAYYRGILDQRDPAEIKELEQGLKLSFQRSGTTAFWGQSRGQKLLATDYPGARGVIAGKVEAHRPGEFLIKAETELGVRDGLLWWGQPGSEKLMSLGRMKDQGGKNQFSAGPGRKVWISAEQLPPLGTDIHKISDHRRPADPGPNPRGWKPQPIKVDLEFIPGNETLGIKWTSPWGSGTWEQEVLWDQARNGGLDKALTKAFTLQEGHFTLGTLKLASGEDLFLPGSVLKDLRRKFYQDLEEPWARGRGLRLKEIKALLPGLKDPGTWEHQPPAMTETFYSSLNPMKNAPQWIFLDPLWFDLQEPRNLLEVLNRPGRPEIFLGLNTLAHLGLLRRGRGVPGVYWFGDYGLYASNRVWDLWFETEFPEIEAITPWIENPKARQGGVLPSTTWSPGRPVPLFLSRMCWRRHGTPQGCKGCEGHWEEVFTQGEKKFRVLARNCLIQVHRLDPRS